MSLDRPGLSALGYAQQSITPTLDREVYLAGFGQNRLAQGVHDDLYVRALALNLGDTCLVLAALDLVGLSRLHCLEIEQRVVERSQGQVSPRLILACTHTHHGPDTIGLWGPDASTSGVDPRYLVTLKRRVVDTVMEALARLQPTGLRTTSVHVPGVAKNARDPQVVDDELTCLQFCRPGDGAASLPSSLDGAASLPSSLDGAASLPFSLGGGGVLATVLLFPCHPEVLWEHNPQMSSDYPHFLRRAVEAETGAPCLFFAGALGGMMTPDVRDHSFEEAEAMGGVLARAALDALQEVEATPVDRLECVSREFAVPMENPVFHAAMRGGLLPHLLTEEGMVVTQANLLKVGSAWLVSVPGELLPKLGLAIKADLRRAGARVAGVIGLANDELGYILPREDYVYPEDPFDPGDHYEETMSIGPQMGPRLLATVRSMIQTTED